jgi:hypothetical protein
MVYVHNTNDGKNLNINVFFKRSSSTLILAFVVDVVVFVKFINSEF